MNRISGKVKPERRKGFTSYVFLLCSYYRNFHGKRGYTIVHNFGTIRDYELTNAAKAQELWTEFDEVTGRLVAENKMWQQHVKDAEKRFQKYIKRPVVVVAAPAKVSTPEMHDTRSEILAKYGLA